MSEDFYHDDPIEPVGSTRKRTSALAALVLFAVGGFYLQSTLAASLSINSRSGTEFGQSVSQTVACSGATSLTLTPRSSFVNGSPGAHYLQSVTVSNVPTSCYGVDFTINAYDDSSSTPVALFNSTSTDAVISNDNGTFLPGIRVAGMTVASGAGAFTVTFTTPVAQSSSVFKLTIQSGLPFIYKVGDRGPGGGFIYYVNDAGFSCGATYTSTGSPTGGKCKYLEVAPDGWNGGSDPYKAWAVSAYQTTDVSEIPNEATPYNNVLGVGLGYKNSLAIVTQNGAYNASSNDYAAGAARAYAGGSKNDWYLPSNAELNLLCQWVRGVAPSVTTTCSGGSVNSSTYGASSAGFTNNTFWSSSEGVAGDAWVQSFGAGTHDNVGKVAGLYVRPVRAF